MLSNELKTQIHQSFKNLKENMNGFIIRQAQNKMIAEISKTLSGEYKSSHNILCVEAPTGTGKTFAYLLGSIPIAKANKKKLIISSANVALQEQLFFRDIPQAQKYCCVDFEYTLIKGRSRYVCIRNLINICENNKNDNPLFESMSLFDKPPGEYQLEQLSKMLYNYLTKKWNGEIDDLIPTPSHSIWRQIACNRFTCTVKNCEFYKDCAFFKTRQKITKADVIIANHDLVLADLSTGNNVLPDVSKSIFIFDEAHHLNSKALSHFSLTTSTEFIKTSVRQTKEVSEKLCKISKQNIPNINIKQIDDYITDLIQLLEQLKFNENIYLFNQGIIDESIKQISRNILTLINIIQTKFTLLKKFWSDYLKKTVINKSIRDPINNMAGQCEQHLFNIIDLFSSFLQIDEPNKVPNSRWIKKSILTTNKKTNYLLNSAQTDISKNLDHLIWSKASGAILTSATLTSLGSFERLNKQLGLLRNENQYLRLPSPFMFNQVDLIIAKLKASPIQVYEHAQETTLQLLKRLDNDEGSLVIFTSNKQMQTVANLIDKRLNCTLLIQGEYPKKNILKKHIDLRKQGKGSIIFGLDSFSEGIDLKGKNLTHVIITKLRFSVPTSPIDRTLATYLKSQNRNPFMEISLPDASLKLIQTCGRLIRSETDVGKITIFDNRLISKFYGKILLNALPNYNIVVE